MNKNVSKNLNFGKRKFRELEKHPDEAIDPLLSKKIKNPFRTVKSNSEMGLLNLKIHERPSFQCSLSSTQDSISNRGNVTPFLNLKVRTPQQSTTRIKHRERPGTTVKFFNRKNTHLSEFIIEKKEENLCSTNVKKKVYNKAINSIESKAQRRLF